MGKYKSPTNSCKWCIIIFHDSLYLGVKENLIVDIGSEQLSYKRWWWKTANALGLKRFLIPFLLWV